MRTAAIAATVALAGATLTTPGAAQSTGTFTLEQGGEQIATESFTRSGERLETELVMTGQGIIATEAVLDDDATVTRLEFRILPPGDPDADPLQSMAAEFEGDSVHVEQPVGTASASGTAPDGAVPYVNPSPSYLEQILRRARAMGASEATVDIWGPGQGAGQLGQAQVTFEGEETATLSLGGVAMEIETDGEGRLLRAEIPAQQLVIERQ